eukprot:2989409-Rhodomonas_salina.1
MAHNKSRKTTKGGDSPKAQSLEQQVLEAEINEISKDYDLLKAFLSEELHLDFAHSITLGYFKEHYYLLFIVGGNNF